MKQLLRKSKIITLITYLINIAIITIFVLFKYIFSHDPTMNDAILFLSIVAVVSFLGNLIENVFFDNQLKSNYIKISTTLGADIDEAYNFGGIGILSLDENGEVIWCSGLFEERQFNVIGTNICNKYPKLNLLFENDDVKTVRISHNQRVYDVCRVEELELLLFKDVTDFDKLEKDFRLAQPVVATILIDDKSSVASVLGEDDYASKEYEINHLIIDWAKNNNILIKKVKDDQFFLVFTEEIYQELLKNNFSILKEVSNISSDSSVTITISLGIARGVDNYVQLTDLSISSTNIAVSRGGNQVIVSNYSGQIEYYCSKNQESRAVQAKLGRTRVMFESLASHMQIASKIYLVPHTEADFDAIGSCLGLFSIATALGKEVKIVSNLNQIELKCRLMFEDNFKTSEYLISPSKAIDEIDAKTLVVVSDVSRAKITTAPQLLVKANNVIIIDHHRESEDCIDNPVLSLIDPSASSASEIIAQMIESSKFKIKLSKEVATFLYAGINLDTQNLTVKVTSTTFKSCMELREKGADLAMVESYTKDEYEEFELKSKILSNISTPSYGFAIALAPDDTFLERAMIAKAAIAACKIKDIKAAFVIGYLDKKTVGISARSDGSVNVQLIMEKMGGGGHFNSAACQLEDVDLEAAKSKLVATIKLYEDEM